MSAKIYVGNLPYSVTDSSLESNFAEFAGVSSTKVMMDRETGRSKGFGFVERVNAEVAQAATAPRATAPANAPTWATAPVASAAAVTDSSKPHEEPALRSRFFFRPASMGWQSPVAINTIAFCA